ncbi:MAG: hypothetical protein GF320_14270 [Armatimonadia bacterium]|nr:hypothetical protein [Armatimonadia bacterium]
MSRTSEGLRRFGLRVPDTQALFGMGIGPGPILLYGLLQTHVGRNDHCWPSQAKLAEELNVDERRIRRWLSQLQKAGVLTVVHTGRRNHYYVHSPTQDGENRRPTPDNPRRSHRKSTNVEPRMSKVVVEERKCPPTPNPKPRTTTTIPLDPTPLPNDSALRYERTVAQITAAQWGAHDPSATDTRRARDRLEWLQRELSMVADTRWAWDLIQRVPGRGTPERGDGGIPSVEHLWAVRRQHAAMGRDRWRRSVRRWCKWHASPARYEELGSFSGWIANDDPEAVVRTECPATVEPPMVTEAPPNQEQEEHRTPETPWQRVLHQLGDEPGWQMLSEKLWQHEPHRDATKLVLANLPAFIAVELERAIARGSEVVRAAVRDAYGVSLRLTASSG